MTRYHWLANLRLVEARGTTMSAEYSALLDFLHRCPPDDREEPAWTSEFHPYDSLSARYCITPPGEIVRNAELVDAPEMRAARLHLWDRKAAPPRAWMARSVALVPELRRPSRADLTRQTNLIFLDQGTFRDLLATALVESDSPDPLFAEICGAPSRAQMPMPSWLTDSPEHIELEIELAEPGLLILADAYDPGWAASRETPGESEVKLAIFRTNRVLCGVCLPAGRHHVHFRYQPWEIPVGGWISLITLIIGLPAATFLRLRHLTGWLHSPLRRKRQGPD